VNLQKETLSKIKRLEELVLDAPAVQDSERQILVGLTEKIIVPLFQLGADVLWAEYDRAEDLLQVCVKIFEKNYSWQEPFVAMIKSQRGSAEPIPLIDAVRMAGIHNTRLHLIVCFLADLLPVKDLARDPQSGRFINRVPQILKYTTQVNQLFPDDTRYFGSAQCAGLLYDFLYLLEMSLPERTSTKKFNDLLTASMTESATQATYAINLARARTRMVLEKHIPATIMIANAGRAVFGLFQPAYFDFIKKMEKLKVPPPIEITLERSLFGCDHLLVASFLSAAFEPVKIVGRSLAHMYKPFELDAQAEVDHYDLSCMTCLAIYSFANNAKVAAMDGKSAKDLRPEFSRFDLVIKAAAFKKKDG